MSTMYPHRLEDPSLVGSYDFAPGDAHFFALSTAAASSVLPFLGDSAGCAARRCRASTTTAAAAVKVLQHYTEGAERATARVPAVEIWNEPGQHRFDALARRVLSLYVKTGALRAAFPDLASRRRLHPGDLADPSPTGWLAAFLDRVAATGAPLDFVSFHIYANDPDAPADLARNLRVILDARGFTATGIAITEWNTETHAGTDLAGAREAALRARGAAILSAT
ncbi:MAG: hypothetical protein U1F43_33760 [Myxococcota bacterium]